MQTRHEKRRCKGADIFKLALLLYDKIGYTI